MRTPALLLLGACLLAPMTRADETTPATDREVLSRPLAGLDGEESERFRRGRSLFRQSWVIAPATDTTVDGLGPLYNRLACISCHAKNGRGGAPEQPAERMQSMLVRLSIPGRNAQGGPLPHPAYGDQLNEEGIPGVPGEGRAHLHWRHKQVRLADGSAVALRWPSVRFSELAYGPLGKVLVSLRVSPHVAGLGLLDAVEDKTLLALAAEKKADGVRGTVNRVTDQVTGQRVAGRFGLKANMPNLKQQIAGAFVGDMGITSPLFPGENCTPAQSACSAAPNGGKPELSEAQLAEIEFYLANLAPPPRRQSEEPVVQKGAALFAELGCATCHRPALLTGEVAHNPRLSRQTFAPYTDLLLHDMGPQLADGRADHLATGRQWRTAPLWGLGALQAINENTGLLHDGRARTAEEAILWHGGEGEAARRRYTRASLEQRRALQAFLQSL
jgi:CxxC motif-containing protein (DUF1111 family)